MRFVASGALLILLGGTLVVPSAPLADWPGFRGPDMSGLALGASLPERWSATDGVRWAVDVPGQGWSSPIVARGGAGGVSTAASSVTPAVIAAQSPQVFTLAVPLTVEIMTNVAVS